MTGEESQNQRFQQHHYGGIVQGIPVVDNPSAPPVSANLNHAPPSYPPATAAPAASTEAPQNYVPQSSNVSGDLSTSANATPLAPVTANATVTNSTTVVVNHVISSVPAPIIEVIDDSLPCGCGTGWFMFIIGWFFAIPWYVGACILICGKIDPRERPGHIACAVMAGIFTIALIVTSTQHSTY